MCGISGFFGLGLARPQSMLEVMNGTLARRGPDDDGFYIDRGVGLAMRRLSIIDLAGGRQPIQNEDGTVTVVFNGEIYNYRELRRELVERGHCIRTHSDTEVIVHLYEDYGPEFVHRLRGMFAIALWDAKRRRGLLVRDRLGIKPLFYSTTSDGLVFGSEIKAVLASGAVERKLDLQALDAFFTFTYIPAPRTIYASVKKLEPGHMLLVDDAGQVENKCYWDLEVSHHESGLDGRAWTERFEEAIEQAVASHLVSDVPVGAFLSGGIDSSLVVALMSGHVDTPVRTFTMGFGGARHALIDERPLAAQVARRYGCEFREYVVQPDLRDIVGEIVDAFDEPFADDSVVPTYYLSKFTRQHVKVALSGLGGDELFAGYERYSGLLLSQYYARFVPQPLHRHLIGPGVRLLREPAGGRDWVNHAKRFTAAALLRPAERYLAFVSTIQPEERRLLFAPDIAAEIDFEATGRTITEPYHACNAPDDVSRALYVDAKTYLPEDILALSDRLSMWHSLEVRVPLVDHKVMELGGRLPVRHKLDLRRKKVLLNRIAEARLPAPVLNHRKQGFESPMAAWLSTDLADYARSVLGEARIGRSGLIDPKYVAACLEDHLARRQRHSKLLFSLIMFQEWYERHFAEG